MRRQAKKRERAKTASIKKDESEGSAKKRPRLHGSTASTSSAKETSDDKKKAKILSDDLASTLASVKKIKTEISDSKDPQSEAEGTESFEGGTLLDVTAKWVLQRLNIENVTELVMTSMVSSLLIRCFHVLYFLYHSLQ